MKTENEIKTALLNEVIEYMNEMYFNGKTYPFVYINDIKQKLYTMMRPDENESLLPKEEPEPTQSMNELRDEFRESLTPEQLKDLDSIPTQEIKAGDSVFRIGSDKKEYMVIHLDGETAWIKAKNQNFGAIENIRNIRKVQPTKTQEEMDREKAEDAWEVLCRKNGLDFSLGLNILKGEFMDEYLEAINYGRNTKQN